MNRLHHLVLCNAIVHNYLAERNWWLVKCRRRGEALGPLGWKPLDVTHRGENWVIVWCNLYSMVAAAHLLNGKSG